MQTDQGVNVIEVIDTQTSSWKTVSGILYFLRRTPVDWYWSASPQAAVDHGQRLLLLAQPPSILHSVTIRGSCPMRSIGLATKPLQCYSVSLYRKLGLPGQGRLLVLRLVEMSNQIKQLDSQLTCLRDCFLAKRNNSELYPPSRKHQAASASTANDAVDHKAKILRSDNRGFQK